MPGWIIDRFLKAQEPQAEEVPLGTPEADTNPASEETCEAAEAAEAAEDVADADGATTESETTDEVAEVATDTDVSRAEDEDTDVPGMPNRRRGRSAA